MRRSSSAAWRARLNPTAPGEAQERHRIIGGCRIIGWPCKSGSVRKGGRDSSSNTWLRTGDALRDVMLFGLGGASVRGLVLGWQHAGLQ